MAPKKSGIVNGMTQATKILNVISKALRKRGGDDSNLLKILKDPSWASKIAGLLLTNGRFMDEKIQADFFKILFDRGISEEDMQRVLQEDLVHRIIQVIKTARPRETYPVKVDYRLPINVMIEEGNIIDGRINWGGLYTLDASLGEVCVELEILRFGGFKSGLTSSQALSVMDTREYRPANIAELIAYAATYTHKGSWGYSLALGSMVMLGGEPHVPLYKRDGNGYYQGLLLESDYKGNRMWDSVSFLAVKIKKP